MMINALNSGAKGFMADLEDSCSPTWTNIVAGQRTSSTPCGAPSPSMWAERRIN